MAWSFDEYTPVYLQIADRIRKGILSGTYPPNSQIPPVRQLALTAAVNPNTVQHALTELENEGIIHSRGTQGRFVTGDSDKLARARYDEAKKMVQNFLIMAEELSLSTDDLINMIREEAK